MNHHRAARTTPLAIGAWMSIVVGPALAQAGSACSARSAATQTPVIELYTSEGCNSCPPADRWLSALRTEPTIVALAFHVDYWDRLGWRDRFADPRFTLRQAQQQAVNGARFSYTPQVVVAGTDHKVWPALRAPLTPRPPARLALSLSREGDRFEATVWPASDAPRRLAAYWAVTENGHVSAVKAGENEGVTLHHDFVVRDYVSVAPWTARPGDATTLQFTPARPTPGSPARTVNLVVIDADSGKPLQALKLGC